MNEWVKKENTLTSDSIHMAAVRVSSQRLQICQETKNHTINISGFPGTHSDFSLKASGFPIMLTPKDLAMKKGDVIVVYHSLNFFSFPLSFF